MLYSCGRNNPTTPHLRGKLMPFVKSSNYTAQQDVLLAWVCRGQGTRNKPPFQIFHLQACEVIPVASITSVTNRGPRWLTSDYSSVPFTGPLSINDSWMMTVFQSRSLKNYEVLSLHWRVWLYHSLERYLVEICHWIRRRDTPRVAALALRENRCLRGIFVHQSRFYTTWDSLESVHLSTFCGRQRSKTKEYLPDNLVTSFSNSIVSSYWFRVLA